MNIVLNIIILIYAYQIFILRNLTKQPWILHERILPGDKCYRDTLQYMIIC